MSETKVDKVTSSAAIFVDAEGKKALRAGEGGTIATFVMSSLSTDRDGERISPDGWTVPKGTINVLVDHDYKVSNVVGKIVKTWTQGDSYLADIQFADGVEENALAKFVVGMLHAGFLGPVSVGFMPLEWNDPDGKTYTRDAPGPYWGSLPGRLYTKQELLELSMVAVGSNRDAMLVGMRAFGLDAPSDTTENGLNAVRDASSKSGADPDEQIPVTWLQKYFPVAPDGQAGAVLSREQFDRLTEAQNALAKAKDAIDNALQSAGRADESAAA